MSVSVMIAPICTAHCLAVENGIKACIFATSLTGFSQELRPSLDSGRQVLALRPGRETATQPAVGLVGGLARWAAAPCMAPKMTLRVGSGD